MVLRRRVFISAAERLRNTAVKKHRSDSELLATLHPVRPARETNPKHSTPIAISLTTSSIGRSGVAGLKFGGGDKTS